MLDAVPSTATARVLISDDHTIVRHAVSTILGMDPSFSVIGEANTVAETLDLVTKLRPDLLILDISIPKEGGFEVLRQLTQLESSTKVIILSMHEDEGMVKTALRFGASSYLLKDSSPKEIIQALKEVLKGEIYLPKRFEHLRSSLVRIRDDGSRANGGHELSDPLSPLSKREKQIFFMITEGVPNREIAKKLTISPRTVETHRARIMKKFGFISNADLIKFAVRNSLMAV